MPAPLRLRATRAAALAACLLVPPGTSRGFSLQMDTGLGAAGSRSATEQPPSRVPLIATVRLNEVDRGEHALYLEGEDQLLVPRALLADWLPGMPLPAGVDVDGVRHLALRSLPAVRVRFDADRLVVHVTLPPTAFPAQGLRYNASDRPLPTPAEAVSAIVNYQVGASGPTSGGGTQVFSGTLEGVVRRREWLARTALFQSMADKDATTGRGLTFLAREDPIALTRLTFGDFLTGSSDLAGGNTLGGISFARALDLDPYTVRQPGASHREMIDVPSTIEVYVGDNRIIRQAVGPGPVDISNLTYLAGRRDVRVVVRDAFGRERETTFPFYFADRGLPAGVHDYNYGMGVVRRDTTGARGSYGEMAVSAFHRAGIDDVVTLGGQLEATRDVANAGPALTLRLDQLGVVSVAALASHDRVRGRSGWASALGYSFVGGRWSGGAFVRAAARDFTPIIRPLGAEPLARLDAGASASWTSAGWGTFTVSLSERQSYVEQRSRTATLGYSYAINRSWQLQALWRRTDGPVPLREAFVSLQYVDREHLGRVTYREDNGRRAGRVQFGNFQPVGEGFGYTISGEVADGPEGRQRTITPEFVWNTPYATVQGNVFQTTGSDTGSTGLYQLSVNGSIAVVGNRAGFSRIVDDSFAVATVKPPAEGVRVYLNQQLMGRTDGSGSVFLPRLVSSINNAVSIDDRDLPIERSLDRRLHTVVPWPRSGVVVDFEAPLRRSVSMVLLTQRGGAWLNVGRALVVVSRAGGDLEVPTGQGGELYLEDLAPGDYPSVLHTETGRCAFTLRIPASNDLQLRMDDVRTCTPS